MINMESLKHPGEVSTTYKKVKFNEIVEKAKKIAAEMLQKAEGFVKEGEAMIKGDGASWLRWLLVDGNHQSIFIGIYRFYGLDL
jgi:hypothetical protein